jgi:hypothetical protein
VSWMTRKYSAQAPDHMGDCKNSERNQPEYFGVSMTARI